MCYKQKCKVVSLNLAHPVDYFEQICQKFIEIDLYNFELYRFKVGAFFETPCR